MAGIARPAASSLWPAILERLLLWQCNIHLAGITRLAAWWRRDSNPQCQTATALQDAEQPIARLHLVGVLHEGGRWESNPQLPDPQSGALPIELRPPWIVEGSNLRPLRCERSALPPELTIRACTCRDSNPECRVRSAKVFPLAYKCWLRGRGIPPGPPGMSRVSYYYSTPQWAVQGSNLRPPLRQRGALPLS